MTPPRFNDPLRDPKLKIKWAKRETQNINTAVTQFSESKPYGIRIEVDFNAFQKVFKFGLTEDIPELLQGSIIQTINSIRSSLDILLACLSKKHTGNATKTVKFPFGKTKDIFAGELSRIKKLIPGDAIPMIEGLHPYKGGNDFLFALHNADVAGKHQKIVDVKVLPHSVHLGGKNKKSGTLSTKSAGHLIIKPGAFRNWVRLEEGVEFMRIPLDAEAQFDYNATLDVFFSNIDCIESQPVTAILNQFCDLAERIILSFEKRFF